MPTSTLSPVEKQRQRAATASGFSKYTDEEKLTALREAAALNNGRIGIATYRRLRRSHPHWPSADVLVFGGWNRLVKDAGLPTWPTPKGLAKPSFHESDFRKALERVGGLLQRTFSMDEYDTQKRPSDPSANTVRCRFGGRNRSWVVALEHLVPELFVSP